MPASPAVPVLPAPATVPPVPPAPTAAELAAAHGLTPVGARSPLAEYARLLWGRRHFVVALATARQTALYSGARLGQLWQVLTPLLNAAVYFLIFGDLLGTGRGVPDYIPFLCTGVFVFTFTQSAALSGARSLTDNAGLVRALHFPRASLPLAATVAQLQQLLLSLAVLAAVLLADGVPLTARWLLAPPALVLQTLFNCGLALALARIGARTTDFAQVLPFVLRTWMYVSGIFYDLSRIAGHAPHTVRLLLDVNPALIYVSLMRYALIDSVSAHRLPPHVWPLALIWATVAASAGYAFFWSSEEEYGRG
ncbi:ABC transporter permease [Actinacidiphila acididurans]|uniref:ABC transporter permease n=1 Tax=Actinacidiphila acididurans TaxID=2784346 RepID=UPI0027DC7C62|nr:ABC transporter permease [Actinacidiphila acididurans]